jgi:putative peptide zinc metalloprotease protein
MLAVVSFTSLIAMPLYNVGKFFYVPGRLHKVKRKNVNITLGILAAVAAFILFCPLPYRVMCPLELKLRGAEPVYVQIPGILEEINVTPGQQVKKGDKLGQLSSIDLDLDITGLEAKVAQDKVRRIVLRHQFFALGNETAQLAMKPLAESLESSEQQLAQRQQDRTRLDLVAPIAGTVLPAQEVPKRADSASRALSHWSGNLLENKNLGAYLEPATIFCQIGNPTKWEASIVIDQDNIEYVHQGQQVKIKLDRLPYRTFETTIDEIGPEMEFSSSQLSSRKGGELMTKVDETGRERPINISYQARADLTDESGTLVQGLRGNAKINAQWQPLGKRLWRYIMRTFNFRL